MHFALPRSRRLSDKEPPVSPDAAINRAGANRPRRSDLVFTNDKVSTRQACFASCGMFLVSFFSAAPSAARPAQARYRGQLAVHFHSGEHYEFHKEKRYEIDPNSDLR